MNDDAYAVLVVDDNEDNRYTLTRRLKRQGYDEVATAEDGRKALEMLGARSFDLVLLDIMMPEMDGYEVLEAMKADSKLRGIPVVMISALDEIDSIVRCIELGAEDYLPKPFNPTLLRSRVEACLEKKRLRDRETAYLERPESEKERSGVPLRAVLPAGAVQEFEETGAVKPRRFEDVAVLCCDVAGFAGYCDEHPPEQAVGELQSRFERFEAIALEHGLEKVRTVGSAFLAAAGLPHPVADPLLQAARCGLAVATATAETAPHWQVRIGVHSGPVVAGVMGSLLFPYDLWGDTVECAVRLAGHANPGRVVMTTAIWARIENRCRGRACGPLVLKGMGEVELVECLETLESGAGADSEHRAPSAIDARPGSTS